MMVVQCTSSGRRGQEHFGSPVAVVMPASLDDVVAF